MKVLLLKYWDRIRTSFWFLPASMAIAAVILASSTVAFDAAETGSWLSKQGWVYAGGAEGASAVLGAIAGSMITIAGVVFSLTLVALSQAASQFGPRLLRNFMRDLSNQFVLGTFVATFLYCLLVLRTIRREDESLFVPHLSVTLGVVFAVASLGVLIYFIHHVSLSIQADEIVARVGAELMEGIDRLFPEQIGKRAQPEAVQQANGFPENFEQLARPVIARQDGYLQIVDAEGLMSVARRKQLLLQIVHRPGHYVVSGQPIVLVWPPDCLSDGLCSEVRAAFVIGKQRTEAQDAEYAVHQLVEIAVRALSPGVNDPFTAISCVDRLCSALSRLAGREMPSPWRRDDQGTVRVVAPAVTFADVADAAFHQIRQNARTSAAVTIRLLEAISVIAAATCRPEDSAALRRHAAMIAQSGRDALPEGEDRQIVEERFRTALQRLK